jgi:hypothetical protein
MPRTTSGFLRESYTDYRIKRRAPAETGSLMAERVVDCALKLQKALGEMERLNLWEIRAILGETRAFAGEVLLWLAAREKIVYAPMGDQLFVSLKKGAREKLGSPQLSVV